MRNLSEIPNAFRRQGCRRSWKPVYWSGMNNNNTESAPLTLVAADDHRLFLEGLASLFQRTGDYELVAVCEDGERLLALVEEHRPDIVLLDVSMPGAAAETIVATIRARYPGTKVIAVTMHLDLALAGELFGLGLAGYVSKADAFDELGEAIAALARGESYRSPALASAGREAGAPPGGLLSERELAVLRCAASGKNNHEIADALSISERTVRFHLTNCCEKLKARGRSHAIALAMRRNLLCVG